MLKISTLLKEQVLTTISCLISPLIFSLCFFTNHLPSSEGSEWNEYIAKETSLCSIYIRRVDHQQYLWCNTESSPSSASQEREYLHEIYLETVYFSHENLEIRGPVKEPDGFLLNISGILPLPEALSSLISFSGITLHIPIKSIHARDLSLLKRLKRLSVIVSEINRCAFIHIGQTLERLFIKTTKEEEKMLLIHRDAFYGAVNVYDLTFNDIDRFNFLNSSLPSICHDPLCALTSLKELHYGRDSHNMECDKFLSGLISEQALSSSGSIGSDDSDHEEFTSNVTCHVTNHFCVKSFNDRCGAPNEREMVCGKELYFDKNSPDTRQTTTGDIKRRVWIVYLILLIVLLSVALLGVICSRLVQLYQFHKQQYIIPC